MVIWPVKVTSRLTWCLCSSCLICTIVLILVPPSEPIITDQNGEILPTKSVIGPYNEGDKLILVCQVEGGES